MKSAALYVHIPFGRSAAGTRGGPPAFCALGPAAACSWACCWPLPWPCGWPALYWDSGYLFHPDERKILTVAAELRFPWRSPGLFLSVDSPWNPRFFSYGSLPIYLVRIASGAVGVLWPPARGLAGSAAVGRALSALADVGSVALVYLLGRRLHGRGVGLLAAAFLAFAPLHIQVSHYYAVDTLLTCLVLLTLYLALDLLDHPSAARTPGGVGLGAAVATKLTALPLAAPVGVAWYLGLRRLSPQDRRVGARWALREAAGGLALTTTMAAAAFVLLEPYALINVARFLRDVVFEARMAAARWTCPTPASTSARCLSSTRSRRWWSGRWGCRWGSLAAPVPWRRWAEAWRT